ncbi:MAG: 3,4-dihydroxy-2-butanone-4-phosphate synthase, partial [Bacteroidota bacterium]
MRHFNTIEEAVRDIRSGKTVIVVDDEDRENEGDFVCAAEYVDSDVINFLARHGRGIICAPISPSRAVELGLDLMVDTNTSLHETPFTVSVDFIHGTETGVSASDRAAT